MLSHVYVNVFSQFRSYLTSKENNLDKIDTLIELYPVEMKLVLLNILTIRFKQNFELSFSLLIMVCMQIWKAPLLTHS
jgi:hypothetical protein